jgi:acyl transferase domain-containing protein
MHQPASAGGCAGFLLAMCALQQQAHAAVMHCRNVNPYVVTCLTEWRATARIRGGIPRQPGPRASVGAAATAAAAVAGTSSFGMSGVNAHALMRVEAAAAVLAAPQGCWQKDR